MIVCSRYEGTTITDDMQGLVVGIAYVTDDSLLEDESLDFRKCRYVVTDRRVAAQPLQRSHPATPQSPPTPDNLHDPD